MAGLLFERSRVAGRYSSEAVADPRHVVAPVRRRRGREDESASGGVAQIVMRASRMVDPVAPHRRGAPLQIAQLADEPRAVERAARGQT